MKQNTTPTLTVIIPVSLETVKRIEFIFKEERQSFYPALLHKVYDKEDIPLQEDATTDESFAVLLPFTAEETMKLPVGDVYMDTRIVLNNDIIPPTSIVKLNVMATLFGEAAESD